MTGPTHLTLRVELDSQDGSIAGQVLDGDAAGRSFSGWMGLAAVIEDALLRASKTDQGSEAR